MSGSPDGDDLEPAVQRGADDTTHRIVPKGLPLRNAERTGWGVFDSDVSYPVAVIFESAIDHNSKTMMEFCRPPRRLVGSARQDDDVAGVVPATAP